MELRPMSPDELEAFRAHTVQSFADEKMAAEGIGSEEAMSAAEAAWARADPTSGDAHTLARLVVDGEAVGVLWFVVRPEWGRPCLWLYDIEIDEEHRGRGLGRQAMGLLEREARAHGASTIGLHVFGHNERARRLYETLGFRPTSIVMRKDLD